MRTRFFIKLLFVVLILNAIQSWAGDMNLHQAVETAFHDSPKIQRSKSMLEESSWKRVEAFSTFLPTLNVGVSYLTNHKYMLTDIDFGGAPVSVPAILPTTMYQAQANYGLFDGFAGTNRFRAARAMERASQKELEWTEFQVEREVALQFYKTVAANVLKDVAEQNLKTLEDHSRDVGLFKKAGISTNFDVLRVDVQVSEARSEILNAQDNRDVAQGRLAEILGQTEAIEAKGQLPVLKPEIVSQIKNTVENRPDLESLEEKVEGLDRLASASQAHWSPKVGLYGIYQSYNNRNDRFSDSDNFREAYQVGVQLTWNLFDGFADMAKAHESTEQKYQADKSLQMARLKAKQDIDFWKRKYVYFCTVYRARVSDITKSKESVRLAKEGRRVGARTNTDLLDAEAELYRAQAGAVNAQIGSIEALINLELATGQKLSQWN